MLEALRSQEWTLMQYSEVKAALEKQDYLLCPEHKTAEVAITTERDTCNKRKLPRPVFGIEF